MAADTVTFTLPSGARVTCSPEQAKRLGYKPEPAAKRAPAKKSASSKSEK